MEQQLDIFGALYEEYKITKPIRLIEFFAGYGSQNLALKYLGANYESWKICEWATKSIQAYNDLHHEDYTDYSMVYTYQEILDFLYNKGVSMNYDNPMTLEQIKRKGEKWCRNVFNNIIATNNLVNIQQVSGKDLNIVDTDKYDYVLTYSFPCQDLSLAGKRAGMVKGENTRSGMLWEVERILKELCGYEEPRHTGKNTHIHDNGLIHEPTSKIDTSKLPKILLLENVTQLHSKENMPHLQAWLLELEKLGYSSYWQDMNSADYGVPQHRDRTFVVSILGDYYYEFPKKFPLKLVLADMLEDEVDEKYYLSDKMIKYISERGTGGFANADCRINLEVARPITTDPNKRAGTTNYLCNDLPSGFDLNDLCIKIPEATKKGYAEAYEGDGVYINRPHQKRGCVQKGLIQTLKTSPDDVGVVVRIGNYSPSGHNASSIVDVQGIAPTVMENHGTVTSIVEEKNFINILLAIFDLCAKINIEESEKYERSRTLLSILWEEITKEKVWKEIGRFQRFQEKEILQSRMYEQILFENRNNESKISSSSCNSSEYNEITGKKSSLFNLWQNFKVRYTPYRWELQQQQFEQLNIFMQELSYEKTSSERYLRDLRFSNERSRVLQQTLYKLQEIWQPFRQKLKIRKLTPREAGRLMGVRDSDIERMSKNQSNSSLYHLFGDSIVVDVLMNIFKKLL